MRTRPSAWRSAKASRTGVVLTPKRVATALCLSRLPGSSSPLRISARSRAATSSLVVRRLRFCSSLTTHRPRDLADRASTRYYASYVIEFTCPGERGEGPMRRRGDLGAYAHGGLAVDYEARV